MSDNLPRRRIVIVILLAALGLGSLGGAAVTWAIKADTEATRADQAADGIAEACAQVERLGGECAVDPDEYASEQGPPGVDGRGIEAVECISGRWRVTYTDGDTDTDAGACTGRTGSPGADGDDGTEGRDGTDGEPGRDGAPGADGKDGTNGEPGPPGPPGTDGADGRGIDSAECDPNTGRWVITYTDGTVDDDAGPCVLID